MWLVLPERSARDFCDVWGHSALRREHYEDNVGDFTRVNHTCSYPCPDITMSSKYRQMHSYVTKSPLCSDCASFQLGPYSCCGTQHQLHTNWNFMSGGSFS